jgi:ZIP family zinc transporter
LLDALTLGFVAQTSLILCGAIVFWMTFRDGLVGLFAGLGAGLLLGAIAFDLIPSAESLSPVEISAWMLVGVAVFLISDRAVEARFGDSGPAASLGIVIGSIIDGVPESLMFGIQIAEPLDGGGHRRVECGVVLLRDIPGDPVAEDVLRASFQRFDHQCPFR